LQEEEIFGECEDRSTGHRRDLQRRLWIAERVYDAIRLPGMTPATYGRGGKGAHIRWMSGDSPVGRVMVAATERGLCLCRSAT